MARTAREVTCSGEEERILNNIASSRTASFSEVLRAKIILYCLQGMPLSHIAKKLDVSLTMVTRWRNRFIESGSKGLVDLHRKGRPSVYTEKFREDVLRTLESAPPIGYGQWTGSLLAQKLQVSKHAVWRFLREQRISLARKRSWCISTDPEFTSKAADVVGLYLAPPENAFVICVDEKPNIQALERRTGYAVTSDNKLVHGFEDRYKRNGTLNLFAALEVASGIIHTKSTESSQKTKKGFRNFLEEVLADLPEAAEFHIIVDNHAIHKRHEAWLESHANVFFHYTPTYASWLNMVEIWFGILTRQSLCGASFSSTQALSEHIAAFVEAYNQDAQPFVWRKREVKGCQLRNNARNFCN